MIEFLYFFWEQVQWDKPTVPFKTQSLNINSASWNVGWRMLAVMHYAALFIKFVLPIWQS